NAKTLFLLDFLALRFLLINQIFVIFLLTSKWYIVAPYFGVGDNSCKVETTSSWIIVHPEMGGQLYTL
ncbi:MAG: hypothetical protein IJ143_09575, partial [Neisseriaceae bacterium]|nr:hypothetical protein [Neisseriaceae bacterium]